MLVVFLFIVCSFAFLGRITRDRKPLALNQWPLQLRTEVGNEGPLLLFSATAPSFAKCLHSPESPGVASTGVIAATLGTATAATVATARAVAAVAAVADRNRRNEDGRAPAGPSWGVQGAAAAAGARQQQQRVGVATSGNSGCVGSSGCCWRCSSSKARSCGRDSRSAGGDVAAAAAAVAGGSSIRRTCHSGRSRRKSPPEFCWFPPKQNYPTDTCSETSPAAEGFHG